jgi:hypothetical protein
VSLIKFLDMKILLIVMIFLSIFVGIPTNLGTISLYGSEFLGAISAIKISNITTWELFKWVLLLIAHIGVVCLPFLVKKSYFRDALIIVPSTFILLYILWDLEAAILLVPFIIVWIACLIKLKDQKIQTT